MDFNLLPWRELERQNGWKKWCLTQFIVFMFSIVILLAMYQSIQQGFHQHSQHLKGLNDEISKINLFLKKLKNEFHSQQLILQENTLIFQRQLFRVLPLFLITEVGSSLPRGVYLEQITQIGNHIRISGLATSNRQVTLLMQRLMDKNWIVQAKLTEMNKRDNSLGPYHNFQIQFSLERRALITCLS